MDPEESRLFVEIPDAFSLTMLSTAHSLKLANRRRFRLGGAIDFEIKLSWKRKRGYLLGENAVGVCGLGLLHVLPGELDYLHFHGSVQKTQREQIPFGNLLGGFR